MMAAREQVLRTRNIGKAVDKEDIDSSCRMCGETEGEASHTVSKCTKQAQKKCKNWRHDKMAMVMSWNIFKKNIVRSQSRKGA